MKRLMYVVAGAALLSLLASSLSTAAIRAAETIAQIPQGLPAARQWVAHEVALGRLRIVSGRTGGVTSCSREDHTTGMLESYQIYVAPQGVATRYDIVSPREKLLTLFSPTLVEIEYRRVGEGTMEFKQPREGQLSLVVRTEGASQQIVERHTAPTIWHLLLAAPGTCERWLLPVLRLHRTDWDLPRQAAEIERLLLRAAEQPLPTPAYSFDALLAQLDADTFAERCDAERRLRRLGPAGQWQLARLNPQSLTPQQRLVRRTMLGEEARTPADLPICAAGWLAADPGTWEIVASRGDPAQRRLAAERLALLTGRPITFEASRGETPRR